MTAGCGAGFGKNLAGKAAHGCKPMKCVISYDGNLEIQWRDGNNLPTLTLTRSRDLSGSLQGAGGIGGLLARTDAANGQTACFHADGNGNVTAMVNAQQVVVAKYIYDPFGN